MTIEDPAGLLDLLMDRLPMHARNKVLAAIDSNEDLDLIEVPIEDKKHFHRKWPFLVMIPVLFLWTLPLLLVGALLCCTIILAPLGFLVMAISCWPIAYLFVKTQVEETPKKKTRKSSE